MAFSIDTTTEFGQRLQQRLDTEQTAWLVVINDKNEPVTTLVWFIWHNDAAYLFSEPHVGKVKAIRNNTNVALHFNSDPDGNNMIVLNGIAELLDTPAAETIPPAYLKKYREGMAHLELTEEKMLAQYSQPIRIVFNRVRGH